MSSKMQCSASEIRQSFNRGGSASSTATVSPTRERRMHTPASGRPAPKSSASRCSCPGARSVTVTDGLALSGDASQAARHAAAKLVRTCCCAMPARGPEQRLGPRGGDDPLSLGVSGERGGREGRRDAAP
eukprot:scaffold1253_cov245-Pinguiococcus_pyrenoidosus.AAC.27